MNTTYKMVMLISLTCSIKWHEDLNILLLCSK